MRRLGRKPVLWASVGATLAVLAGAALAGAAGAATSASTVKAANGTAAVTVGATPLGVDVGPWDTLFSNPATFKVVEPLLKAIDISQLHYGGGGTADQYDEQTNTVVNGCGGTPTLADFSAACAKTEPLDFAHFSADARALGAQSFATVNYGTGTPGMAAAYVSQSETADQGVAQWDIGNESYGCWEDDNWLLGPPLDDTAYEPNYGPSCPWNLYATQADGVTEMADSYAYNAAPYMEQMTAADPSIKIGVPWAFGGTVGGAAVPNNTSWDETLLTDLDENGLHVSFVEAHWYPFSFGADVGVGTNKTAQQVIQSVEQIPADYASIRDILNTYDRSATVTVGETGVSYLATSAPCQPVGALFASGDVLSWLAAGAQTVDWWPLETGANAGSACTVPEEAMFTGNGTPDTVYTGYLLASELAKPNAQLSALTVPNVSDPADTSDTFGFQSVLPDGQVVVALYNANTTYAQKVAVSTSLAGNLATQTYSAGTQNPSNSEIVDGTSTAGAVANGITLPPESVTILKSYLPSKVTVDATTPVKAGAKVTISGRLTLNGAAAPAGLTVKIYRRAFGSSVNAATLTATTKAGGTFTATDLPAEHGGWDYVASYPGTSLYAPASAAFLVHVVSLKPTLKLKFSAGVVKPGKKVIVTATLGAWHTNRTLVIYEQVKGGAKKVIKRGAVNSKGQLAVVFVMKANTVFTVAYAGDGWYTPGSLSAVVKI